MLKVSLFLLAAFAAPVFAQPSLHISNTDAKWGETITIDYHASEGSRFASDTTHDTLFCAALIEGAKAPHALIRPMMRVATGSYEAIVTIPDSTSSVQVFVGTPKGSEKKGSSQFTCLNAQGQPTPGYRIGELQHMDQALSEELAAYPPYYRAYFRAFDYGKMLTQAAAMKRTENEWWDTLRAYVARIESKHDNSIERWATLGALYSRLGDDKSMTSAFEHAAKCKAYESILNDRMFWGRLLYPQQKNGKYQDAYPTARLLTPLCEQFPNSSLTEEWLQMSGYDTLLSKAAFNAIAPHWANSKNVDALSSIASIYANEKSPAHNAKEAMIWCDRATNALLTGDGFRSGEYVYGYGGRIG